MIITTPNGERFLRKFNLIKMPRRHFKEYDQKELFKIFKEFTLVDHKYVHIQFPGIGILMNIVKKTKLFNIFFNFEQKFAQFRYLGFHHFLVLEKMRCEAND